MRLSITIIVFYVSISAIEFCSGSLWINNESGEKMTMNVEGGVVTIHEVVPGRWNVTTGKIYTTGSVTYIQARFGKGEILTGKFQHFNRRIIWSNRVQWDIFVQQVILPKNWIEFQSRLPSKFILSVRNNVVRATEVTSRTSWNQAMGNAFQIGNTTYLRIKFDSHFEIGTVDAFKQTISWTTGQVWMAYTPSIVQIKKFWIDSKTQTKFTIVISQNIVMFDQVNATVSWKGSAYSNDGETVILNSYFGSIFLRGILFPNEKNTIKWSNGENWKSDV